MQKEDEHIVLGHTRAEIDSNLKKTMIKLPSDFIICNCSSIVVVNESSRDRKKIRIDVANLQKISISSNKERNKETSREESSKIKTRLQKN